MVYYMDPKANNPITYGRNFFERQMNEVKYVLEISEHDCVHYLLTYFRVLPFDLREAFEAFVCRDSNESRRDRL